MRDLTQAHHPSGSVVPPEPTEVAIAGVRWRRTGFLQRLAKADRNADALAALGREPAEKLTARRAA